jgi:hypothetical protein
MAFDQKTRNLLQRTVSACRKILDEEFAAQRREIFGINDDGSVAPFETLAHLPDEDMQVARLLRDRLDHLSAGLTAQGKKESDARKESVGRITREQAFTVLNRLAALRMAEEREIVLECVRHGLQSEGFQLFQQTAGSAFGDTWQAYRAYLLVIYDEIAIDLGVLFSRWDPAGLLFPGKDALEAVLKELGGTGTAMAREEISPEEFNAIWSEDETIGWIYQYYNDQAERKKMREESAAPRNSRELAVRNQFFTPRYVVEFLTDNTLGRIWYEMTQGESALKEQCRYLVRRPNEIFLKECEAAPSDSDNSESIIQNPKSQEELLLEPVHIQHRPLKDPRTILMLDPACGSMHFGLYAFDLFEVIYDEAWALEEQLGADALSRPPGMKSLHATYAGKDAFLKDVPRLIIEHNLHGIDIDPRCAQIAGLSLWLRAQKAWQRLGLKPAERPAIKRSNIVCAEPMPGEKELLREFVEREFPAAERAVCLRLLEAIFDKMQLAGEAGSLLKIEEEIRSAIEDARDAWQKLATKPQELFTATELNQLSTAPELTGLEQAVSSLTTDPRHLTTDFWERIEERIYAALRDYAEQAENGGGFQRRLFAEDAARGFAFIDVCRKRYDVVLMNPPFGDSTIAMQKYITEHYPRSFYDLLGAFTERGAETLSEMGRLGAITSRTGFFLSRMEDWRRALVFGESRLSLFADLGQGVLDSAMVETAAYVVCRQSLLSIPISFFGLMECQDKGIELLEALRGNSPSRHFVVQSKQLEEIPGAPLAYWPSPELRLLYAKFPSFSSCGGEVKQGLASGDDFRFLRLFWEVTSGDSGRGHTWVTFAKGGEFQRYYYDPELVVNWSPGAKEIYWLRTTQFPVLLTQNADKYCFRPSLTYPQRTQKGFNVRQLPANALFGAKGPAIYPSTDDDLLYSLGLFNSEVAGQLLEMLTCFGSYNEGYVAKIPFPPASLELRNAVDATVRQVVGILQLNDFSNEVSHLYVHPFWSDNKTEARILPLREKLEGFFSIAYGISESGDRPQLATPSVDLTPTFEGSVREPLDAASYIFGVAIGRWDIRYATGEQAAPELPDPFAPLPVCPPGQLQNAQGLPARPEDVPAAYPVRIPWDGILVDDPNHPLDIERRVREVIEIIWSGKEGGPTAEDIEHEACEILGVKSLRDYFRKPAGFFADHLKRYSKSRRQAPIYWPLSTASGSYTLWIYYHRLTNDTLYKCLSDFVEPKIADLEKDIHRYRTMVAAEEAGTRERKQLADAESLLDELRGFHADLSHWAPRWKPNLNDGVVITAAPLWSLFALKPWQKKLKETWQDLEKGYYDWAHLALTLWPDRVREKCKKDRSLAIAHDLEDLCEIQAPVPNKRAAKKAAKTKAKPDGLEDLL